MIGLPIIKFPEFYGGQMGVPGSEASAGLRSRSQGYVIYVDNQHPDTSDAASGWSSKQPLTTIAAALVRLATLVTTADINPENSVIVVAPGTYAESVSVIQTTHPDFCSIVAGGNGQYDVIWQPAAGGDCLTLDAYGWRVEGIHFQPGSAGAGIKLTRSAGAGAEGTVINNCFFDGLWGTGLYGVEFDGAPANVTIAKCRFAEFDSASPCITLTATGTASPSQAHIVGNTFQECAEYITSVVGGWNACLIAGNLFAEATGDLAATTTYIDLGTGSLGYNIVTQNIFGGDYSNTGGYTAESHALDNWVGNMAFDVGEAETADNGFTIAEPAA